MNFRCLFRSLHNGRTVYTTKQTQVEQAAVRNTPKASVKRVADSKMTADSDGSDTLSTNKSLIGTAECRHRQQHNNKMLFHHHHHQSSSSWIYIACAYIYTIIHPNVCFHLQCMSVELLLLIKTYQHYENRLINDRHRRSNKSRGSERGMTPQIRSEGSENLDPIIFRQSGPY